MADHPHRGAARWATLVALPVAALAGLLAYAVLGGFGRDVAGPGPAPTSTRPRVTSPVTTTATPLPPRARAVCRALLARLPATVQDLARRPVTAEAGQNAAYGEPPVTLTCGPPAPAFPPTDKVFTLSGVCWHPAEGPDATVWTTADREVPVHVRVPGAYQGQLVVEFSGPVLAAVPPAASAPSGCDARAG